MANTVKITARDATTIEVTLPDGMSVQPGEPVPVELLEMIVSFARLQAAQPEAGPEELAAWCIGGCGVQV